MYSGDALRNMGTLVKRAFAVAAHPDDIEFMMGGTLFLLREAGYELHYMNIANGDRGSAQYDQETTARVRREEAKTAAAYLGAHFHESICSDLEVFYQPDLLKQMTAVMREVAPEILLVQYPFDYMEDHCNAVRLAIGAAFARGMKNWESQPPRPVVTEEVTVYHAMPYGLRDPLRQPVRPEFFVDITDVLEYKREMLAKHRSQKEWLDASQGMNSYLHEMESQAEQCGRLSGRFNHAEGWTRRLPLGFCGPETDPLGEVLSGKICRSPVN